MARVRDFKQELIFFKLVSSPVFNFSEKFDYNFLLLYKVIIVLSWVIGLSINN